MYDIGNKVFLVTGAASGIGAGVTKAILEKGAKHVAILDVNESQGKVLEEELNKKHGEHKAKFIKCDVTNSDLDCAFEEVLSEFGYIDVVINNAGIMNDRPNIFEKEIAINFTALIKSSLKAYSLMRIDKNGNGGTIINISSIVGLFQSRLIPIYSATKSAVLQFSNCLGSEQNFTRSAVRVVTVCFGTTETGLISGRIGSIDEECEEELAVALRKLPSQDIDSAVNGLIEAFENGASGSTWLVTSRRPAEEITNNVRKAYEILSQGVFY